MFQGINFAFAKIGSSSCNILLEKANLDHFLRRVFIEFRADLKDNNEGHYFC